MKDNKERLLEIYREKAKLIGCRIDEEHICEIYEGWKNIGTFLKINPETSKKVKEINFNNMYISLRFSEHVVWFLIVSFSELVRGASEYWIGTDGTAPILTLHYTGIIRDTYDYNIKNHSGSSVKKSKDISYTDILDMALISLKTVSPIHVYDNLYFHRICKFLDDYGETIKAGEFNISPVKGPFMIEMSFKADTLEISSEMTDTFAEFGTDLRDMALMVENGKVKVCYSILCF